MNLGIISAFLGVTSFGYKSIKATPELFDNLKKIVLEEDFTINKPFLAAFRFANSFIVNQYQNADFTEAINELNKYQDDRIVNIFEIADTLEFNSNFELNSEIKTKFNQHLNLFYGIELNDEFFDEWLGEFNKHYKRNLANFINKNKDLYSQHLLKINLVQQENLDELFQLIKITGTTLNESISTHTELLSNAISDTGDKILQNQSTQSSQLTQLQSSMDMFLSMQSLDAVKFDDKKQQELVDHLRALIKECKFTEAISTFKKLFTKVEANFNKVNLAIIYSNYGICYLGIGNQEEAINCFQKALEYDSECENAKFNIFVTQINTGDLSEAEETFKLLDSTKNKYFEAQYALSLVREKYDDTLQLLEENTDKFEEINLKKAKIYFQRKDYDNAINYLNLHLHEHCNDYVALSLLVHAKYNKCFAQTLLMHGLYYIKDKFIIDGPIISDEQRNVLNDIKTQINLLLSFKENSDARVKQARLTRLFTSQ